MAKLTIGTKRHSDGYEVEYDSSVEPADQEGSDAPEEFGRFEALTRELVKVPKRELDEKRRGES
jgi:hypothetical protein